MAENLKKLLSEDDLKTVADAIAKVEWITSGEVRVSIRQERSRGEQGVSVETLARREFAELGMVNTKDRTGVLLFFLAETRQFYILADAGIDEKVPEGTWQLIADIMSEHFSKQNFCEGIASGVRAIGKVLAQHFPRSPDDTNELSNQVRVT